jgi:hypothetical protein
MTISHCIRWSIIGAAALFTMTVRAQETCPPLPEKYRDLEFGHVRFAVEEGCRSTFTQNEQFFLAGIAQTLISNCKQPRNREGRALMERFTKAAILAVALRKPEGPLYERIISQQDHTAAFAAGRSMMEDIRCNGPEAALLARGIVIYLKRTSGASRFVTGCVEFYAGRHTEKQCRCIADTLRPLLPDIDQRFFDREIVKASVHHSPKIALSLMVSCSVENY